MADELFEKRPLFKQYLDKYQRCHAILHRLRHRTDKRSVEQVLSELQEEAADNPDRETQLAAIRFYLGDLLWQCKKQWVESISSGTNYDALVDDLVHSFRNEQLCFVTFNYDTMLEDALCKRNLRFGYDIKDYIANNSLSVIKLHGSVNWARVVVGGIGMAPNIPTCDELIEEAHNLELGQYVMVEGNAPLGDHPKWGGHYAFPVLALPLTNKRTFACPDDHVSFLKEQLPHVDKLLIIGWRAADTHFVDLLKEYLNPPVRTLVVSANKKDAESVIRTLKNTHKLPVSCVPFDDGFSHFVVPNGISQLLGSR